MLNGVNNSKNRLYCQCISGSFSYCVASVTVGTHLFDEGEFMPINFVVRPELCFRFKGIIA